MCTNDDKLWRLFFEGSPEMRVKGFAYGYQCVFGKGRDFLENKEYQQGWDEGKSLRFDEMKAAAKQGKALP